MSIDEIIAKLDRYHDAISRSKGGLRECLAPRIQRLESELDVANLREQRRAANGRFA